MVSIIGSGRSFGGGQGNPLQYACLENTMDRGAWRVTIHWVAVRYDWSDLAHTRVSQVALVIKNLPADAGASGDAGSIPASGRSSGGRNSTHSSMPGESYRQRILQPAVHGITKSQTILSILAHLYTCLNQEILSRSSWNLKRNLNTDEEFYVEDSWGRKFHLQRLSGDTKIKQCETW